MENKIIGKEYDLCHKTQGFKAKCYLLSIEPMGWSKDTFHIRIKKGNFDWGCDFNVNANMECVKELSLINNLLFSNNNGYKLMTIQNSDNLVLS